jgi:hypothetical protein
MKLAWTCLAGVVLIASACIHRSPEAEIRAALLDKLPNRQPSAAPPGARCSEPQVRGVQIMGTEAIASIFQDCSSGSGVTRISTDYLLVKQGQKWTVVKPLSGAIEARS